MEMPTLWMIKSIFFHAVFCVFFSLLKLMLVMLVVTVLQCSVSDDLPLPPPPYPHAPLSPSLICFMVSIAKMSVTAHTILSVSINLPRRPWPALK